MNTYKKQSGYSLIELMIAGVLSLAVFAGMVGLLIASDDVTTETIQDGELQELGTFVLNLISDDIRMAGYFGPLTGVEPRVGSKGDVFSLVNNVGVTADDECASATLSKGGYNNGTFPSHIEPYKDVKFLYLWMGYADSADALSCITDASINSSILQIKRAILSDLDVENSNDDNEVNSRFYLKTNVLHGVFYAGNNKNSAEVDNFAFNDEGSQIMEYQHHIYYIKHKTLGGVSIPILNQISLEKEETAGANEGKMVAYEIAEGIEAIEYQLGIDDSGDGTPNYYLSPKNMTYQLWANAKALVSAKIFVLVRALEPDADYKNEFSYDLGNRVFVAPSDSYRRMLFTNTVSLNNTGNTGVNSWQE